MDDNKNKFKAFFENIWAWAKANKKVSISAAAGLLALIVVFIICLCASGKKNTVEPETTVATETTAETTTEKQTADEITTEHEKKPETTQTEETDEDEEEETYTQPETEESVLSEEEALAKEAQEMGVDTSAAVVTQAAQGTGTPYTGYCTAAPVCYNSVARAYITYYLQAFVAAGANYENWDCSHSTTRALNSVGITSMMTPGGAWETLSYSGIYQDCMKGWANGTQFKYGGTVFTLYHVYVAGPTDAAGMATLYECLKVPGTIVLLNDSAQSPTGFHRHVWISLGAFPAGYTTEEMSVYLANQYGVYISPYEFANGTEPLTKIYRYNDWGSWNIFRMSSNSTVKGITVDDHYIAYGTGDYYALIPDNTPAVTPATQPAVETQPVAVETIPVATIPVTETENPVTTEPVATIPVTEPETTLPVFTEPETTTETVTEPLITEPVITTTEEIWDDDATEPVTAPEETSAITEDTAPIDEAEGALGE